MHQGNRSSEVFTLKRMGEVKFLLGIEITIDRTHNKIVYCQRAHIDKIIKTYGMQDAHGYWIPQSTSESKVNLMPLEPGIKLPYLEIVGSLQYLVSGSRPDITHAVRHLGKSCRVSSKIITVMRRGYALPEADT